MPAPISQPVRILVIDDDPVMRELLTAVLSTENFLVEAVDTGEAVLTHLQAGPQPTVILTDIQLPGLSGPALAARLRATAPQSRLLGMSGSEPGSATCDAFDAFLLKPFSTEDFANAVDTVQQPTPDPPQPVAKGDEPLDESTYSRLAAALPPAQLAELYQLTLADITTRLDSLQAALSATNLESYRREAHALKGGCSMVGAREIASRAAEAETVRTGTEADTTFAALPPAFGRLRDILSARLMHYK